MEHPAIYGSIDRAAAEAAVSPRTIYRLLSTCEVRAVKVRGRTLVDLNSLRVYLASLPPAPIRRERVTRGA